MNVKKSLMSILETQGFSCTAAVNPVLAGSEYTAALELLGEVTQVSVPARFQCARNVHWVNEWHDEELTQVQAFVVQPRVGLGTVKRVMHDVADVLFGTDAQIEVKSEYVPDVVPSIEFKVKGVPIASGGFIRDDVMERAGLKGYAAVVITFIAERIEGVLA